MNTSAYLSNPVIAKGFYNVKCLEVEVIDGYGLPTIVARLQVVPYTPYGVAQNAVLHVTLRSSPAAGRMHEMFRRTFRVEDDPAEAVGRFGCVLVDEAEFRGRKYGGVHFIEQSEIARRNAAALEQADAAGEIPWPEDAEAA